MRLSVSFKADAGAFLKHQTIAVSRIYKNEKRSL